MEPIQHMLGFRRDVLLQAPKHISATRQEDNLLLRPHSLLTKRIDEPRTRLVVDRLDETETASGRIRIAAMAMKRDQALAGDDFEPVLCRRRFSSFVPIGESVATANSHLAVAEMHYPIGMDMGPMF